MSLTLFIFRFLPLFIVLVFFKGVINYIFSIWFIDVYFAFALACIIYFKFNFLAGLSVFLVGIMRSFEGYYPLLLFPIFYLFIFWLKEISNKFLKEESDYSNYIFLFLSISLVIILQLFIFFMRLNLYSIGYEFIFSILIKVSILVVLTFIVSCGFYKLLKVIFDEPKN